MINRTPEHVLIHHGYSVKFRGITALDLYYRSSAGMIREIETTADIIELSSLFDEIEFPGEDRIDAVIKTPDGISYHVESLDASSCRFSDWMPLNFYYIPERRKFQDPYDSYPLVRSRGPLTLGDVIGFPPATERWWYLIADAAAAVSRYNWDIQDVIKSRPGYSRNPAPLGNLEQKTLLVRVLESPFPEKGLRLLMDSGFIEEHWPLLFSLTGVRQDKDFHPEGDVWQHTLQMFNHMKNPDPLLALGILLHDCGKPFAARRNRNEFDRHAQLGASKARIFLQDLGFDRSSVDQISFFVSNHMLVAHIADIPEESIRDVLDSVLFPKLLELYRCDIESTYRDPGNYYRACEFYRKYKRHQRNPYRSSGGRKHKTFHSRQ